MPLCGSSFCGCALTSVPADFAEINGAFPTIDVAGNGTGASPWNLTLNDEWAGAVAEYRTVSGSYVGLTDASSEVTIPYGVTFSGTPMVVAINGDRTAAAFYCQVNGKSVSSITVRAEGVGVGVSIRVDWIAHGLR